MAVRFSQRYVNEAQTLGNEWQMGSNTDSVKISIYNMDTNAAELASTAMTNETGGLFSYSWTATASGTYRIDYYNETLDSHDFEITQIRGSATTTPSGSSGGSTLTVLRNRFLKMVDNYNGSDLTGTNSSGEIADLCLNDGLQLIYAQLKDSKFMQSYPSTSLVSVASQSYIDLSGITDIDEISALKDTTNQVTLKKISPGEYFFQVPDPTKSTGNPIRYCRIFNRIYLDPQPTSAITYTTEYIKVYPKLSADSDQALIPSKYDDWIMKEARVLWYMMEDITAVPTIVVEERNDAREVYINDAMSNFDTVTQSRPHFGGNRGYVSRY